MSLFLLPAGKVGAGRRDSKRQATSPQPFSMKPAWWLVSPTTGSRLGQGSEAGPRPRVPLPGVTMTGWGRNGYQTPFGDIRGLLGNNWATFTVTDLSWAEGRSVKGREQGTVRDTSWLTQVRPQPHTPAGIPGPCHPSDFLPVRDESNLPKCLCWGPQLPEGVPKLGTRPLKSDHG